MAGTQFIAVGPQGQQFQMKPPPKWKLSSNSDASGGGGPTKMVSKCIKLSYQKMPVTGGEMWQGRFLKLENRTLSYGKDERADEHEIQFEDISAIELASQGDQRVSSIFLLFSLFPGTSNFYLTFTFFSKCF